MRGTMRGRARGGAGGARRGGRGAARARKNWKECYEVLAAGRVSGVGPREVGAALVIDVRPEKAFAEAHAAGSVNVPLFRDIKVAGGGAGPVEVIKAAALLSQGVAATQENPDFVKEFLEAVETKRRDAQVQVQAVVLADAEGGTLEVNDAFPFGKESRALYGCYKLLDAGVDVRLSHLEGGLNAWAGSDMPIEGLGEYVVEARTPQFVDKGDEMQQAAQRRMSASDPDGGWRRGPLWVAIKQARTKTGIFAPGFWKDNPRTFANSFLPLLPLLVPFVILAFTYWLNLGRFSLPFPGL